MIPKIAPSIPADCACCGLARPEADLIRLRCRADIAICSCCTDWLTARRRRIARVMPVLPTADIDASKEFWAKAGFKVESYDEGFAFASQDGVELHLVEAQPGARDRGAAYLHVQDVDALHAAWSEAGLPVSELRSEAWGMREYSVVDPGGNRVRIGENS
jgi:catechol 2,3-dioxygenase-like lactoylglutathione lyase family enzyme